MNSLIIGAGEIGKSLFEVLSPFYNIKLADIHSDSEGEFSILHICFPYSDKFIDEVNRYRELYNPEFIIIHSTIPVGTARLCGAIHSPVVGIHPKLKESLLTFTKFLSGEQASEVADYFRKAGMGVYLFDKPETTELLKILDTTFYGLCVEYTKDIKRECDKRGIPFEAWTIYNENYNKGYQKLGHPEFVRPNLVPIMKKIGGHCVLPNANLLETKFTKLLKDTA